MKNLQATISTSGSSEEAKRSAKPLEDTQSLQNKSTSEYRNISEAFKEDYEEKESAREDPTFDEYHDMKGKNEDDDDKTNSTKESTQANQFADLVAQAELKQQPV